MLVKLSLRRQPQQWCLNTRRDFLSSVIKNPPLSHAPVYCGETPPLRSLIVQANCGKFPKMSGIRCSVKAWRREKGNVMKKTLMALVAVAGLAVATVAAPAPAHAQRGVAAGIAAGLIGGAIVGGAIASQNPYYGPGYYGPRPYYGGPAYVAGPGYYSDCYWQRQRFWDGYGWRIRRVRVCG
jgi:hypothetical protein